MRLSKIISFSVVILLVAVLFAGVTTVPAEAVPADTMQFHYNAAHTGDYSPVAGSTSPNNLLKWSYTTKGVVESSPAVANGVVYVGGDRYLYALNVMTGKLVWSYDAGGPMQSPAVANGVVYVGSSDGYHGYLHAVSATTGTKLWKYRTEAPIDSSPTIVNGVVYVGSTDGYLYAFNAATGIKKWEYLVPETMLQSSPAVANGFVYVVGNNKQTYAINAATGEFNWTAYTGTEITWVAPAVANGVVYVGSTDHKVYALDAATGAKKWSYTTGGAILISSPAIANGVVYVGSDDHKVYALDASSGTKLWSYATGDNVPSSPAFANGVVYVGSADHKVYALDAATGAKKWSYTTGNQVVSSPSVVNGVVYVGSDDHKVYAIGKTPTSITVTASTTTPAVNQPVTFTATLKSGTKLLSSKPVIIYHYLNGVRYFDITKTTNANGQISLTQSFGSSGQRTYYATFAGDTSYSASTSSVLNVYVKAPIRVTLAASSTTPSVNQQVTFTAKLYWWNPTANQWVPVTTGKSVTIYHYLNGVKYTDTTKTTNAKGQISLTQSFGSPGQRTYYATFAGDMWYKASTSAVVTINVH